MDVIAYTASPRDTPESRRDRGFILPGTGDADGTIPSRWFSGTDKASLHKFLAADIDILLISVPLTDKTRHLLDKEESRGTIVVQEAMELALQDGTLRGAALDVTDPEPLPKESKLWDMENVVITPHISGVEVAYLERAFQVLGINLVRWETGKRLLNLVDRKKGY